MEVWNVENSTLNSDNVPASNDPVMTALYFGVKGVFLSILSSVGIVTNVINIYALSKVLRARKHPIYVFLLALAVVDLTIMAIVLVRSARFFLVSPILIQPEQFEKDGTILVDSATYIFYNMWYIPSNVCMTASNWYTVAMAMFRVVAVAFPLRANSWCTASRAVVSIIIISIFSILVNVPHMIELRYEEGRFSLDPAMHKYGNIPLLLTIPFPLLTCLIINILLIYLIKHHRYGTKISGSERTLLGICVFYMVTSTPNVVYYIMDYSDLLAEVTLAKHIFYIFATQAIFVNHACNFFFYMCLNNKFRWILWMALKRPLKLAGKSFPDRKPQLHDTEHEHFQLHTNEDRTMEG